MIGTVFFILSALFVFSTNLFLLFYFKCNYWRLIIWLKQHFPSCPPKLCTFFYYLALLYAASFFVCIFIHQFYYSPLVLRLLPIGSLCMSLFLLRGCFILIKSMYAYSTQWNLDLLYIFLSIISQILFFAMQIVICFITNFDPTAYNSVFLTLNALLCPFHEISCEFEERISFEDFCNQFCDYLQKGNEHIEKQNVSANHPVKHTDACEMSSIPNERNNSEIEQNMVRVNNSVTKLIEPPPLNFRLLDLEIPVLLQDEGKEEGKSVHEQKEVIKESFLIPNAKIELVDLLDKFDEKKNHCKMKTWIKIGLYIVTIAIYSFTHRYFIMTSRLLSKSNKDNRNFCNSLFLICYDLM